MGTVDRISISRGIGFFIASSDVVIIALISVFMVIKIRCRIVMLVVLAGKLDVFASQLYLVSNLSDCHHVDHS